MNNDIIDIILKKLKISIADIQKRNDKHWVSTFLLGTSLQETAVAISKVIGDELTKCIQENNEDELFSKVYLLNTFFSPFSNSVQWYKKNFDLIMSKNIYVSAVQDKEEGYFSFSIDVWIEDKENGEYLGGTIGEKDEDED